LEIGYEGDLIRKYVEDQRKTYEKIYEGQLKFFSYFRALPRGSLFAVYKTPSL
jgi:hypothetical protein